MVEEGLGASSAIGPASSCLAWSAGGVAALSHISRLRRAPRIETERGLAQSFRPRADDNLAKRQQDYRDDERGQIIQDSEQQHAREQFLAVHLPQTDQHGGVKHPEPARRMTGEAKQ